MWGRFAEDQRRSYGSESDAPIPKLDGLVCNAGALLSTRTLTNEGLEVTFAAHLLFGTYLLGTLALPSLAANHGRLIIVSSGDMLTTKFPAWHAATSTGPSAVKYDGQLAYAYAKRGQVLLLAPPSFPILTHLHYKCGTFVTDTRAVKHAVWERRSKRKSKRVCE